MKFLKLNEKIILVILVSLSLIMLTICIYLNLNTQDTSITEQYNHKKIFILHTGGNIENNFEQKYLKNKGKLVEYNIKTYKPLIKSNDILVSDWNKIARDIYSVYNLYDAFIIISGLDTLSYTASALSFMLENLNKPVILTNKFLFSTFLLVSNIKIPEVMVLSHNKLLRGCRTIQQSNEYFISPNYPELKTKNSLIPSKDNIQVKLFDPKIRIIVIKLFPGIDYKYLINIFNNMGVHGVVLETYNTGNIPTCRKFLEVIKKLVNKGIMIVSVSEYNKKPKLDSKLIKAGVIPGYDMTVSATYAKLYFLLSNVKNMKIIRQLMHKSFRGEIKNITK